MKSNEKNFNVKIIGRAGIIYQENMKTMEVDSEMLAGPKFDIVVYRNSIERWNPPHDADYISPADKDRIAENIKLNLEMNDYKVDIE